MRGRETSYRKSEVLTWGQDGDRRLCGYSIVTGGQFKDEASKHPHGRQDRRGQDCHEDFGPIIQHWYLTCCLSPDKTFSTMWPSAQPSLEFLGFGSADGLAERSAAPTKQVQVSYPPYQRPLGQVEGSVLSLLSRTSCTSSTVDVSLHGLGTPSSLGCGMSINQLSRRTVTISQSSRVEIFTRSGLYISPFLCHGYCNLSEEQKSGTDHPGQIYKQRLTITEQRSTDLVRAMADLQQYDYIFAIGMLFAFLDAWNLGANDVASSFVTSISCRSLIMRQAMLIVTVTECTGAVPVGGRVAGSIRNKFFSVSAFEQEPAILMLGMMCASIGSYTWLTVAAKMDLPVSTTLVLPCPCLWLPLTALQTLHRRWRYQRQHSRTWYR